MSKQAEAFLAGEGEAWMKRNENRYDEREDPVLQAIRHYGLKPKSALEIGCADGSRLAVMEREFKCRVEGYDPAYETNHGSSKVQVWAGTADNLMYSSSVAILDKFEMVIYGWCLYLADPEDYFQIAKEGDRVLEDGGHLIVYDFYANYPHKIKYKHKEGLFSYHYDFSKLWLGNPAYSIFGRTAQNFALGNETCVTILRKNLASAFPEK